MHIIYLHGLASSGKIFNFTQSKLPKHKATFINYDSAQSIEDSLQFILSALPKDEPFSILSHSLGGILGHLVATRSSDEYQIDHLITISTPFGGSDTAGKLKWFYPSYKIFKDLAPNSKTLSSISNTPVTKCKFTSLISTAGHLPFVSEINDGVVSLESQRATTAKSTIDIDANHFEVLQDPNTINALKKIVF